MRKHNIYLTSNIALLGVPEKVTRLFENNKKNYFTEKLGLLFLNC